VPYAPAMMTRPAETQWVGLKFIVTLVVIVLYCVIVKGVAELQEANKSREILLLC